MQQAHILNRTFDAVVCISLKRRPDRTEQAVREFEKFGIDVRFIEAVDGRDLPPVNKLSSDNLPVSNGDMGCTLSHLKAIELAKEMGWKDVLITEDDVEFAPTLNIIFEEYFRQLPEDWQMFYLGGNHSEGGFEMISDKIARIKKTYTTHAYAVKKELYDEMIRVLSDTEKVDISISSLHSKFNCYVCRPHIAYQKSGFSDILNREVAYPFLRD